MIRTITKIPIGICIDLETTIAGKIPNSIQPPGQKRFETRIIEIGAVHWSNTDNRFMRLVNPISAKLDSGQQLISHLESIYQKPKATLNFWSKVLVRRKSVNRSMFQKEESPNVWLARNLEYRANDFVRWFNGAHGPEFVTEQQALSDLFDWTGSHCWLAHNGNSFDFKVLQGCALRSQMSQPNIKTYDTLHLFRKHLPGHKSYSQPILYENIFSEKYNAHVAIDDALALAKLCKHCNEQSIHQWIAPTAIKKGKKSKVSMDLSFGAKKILTVKGVEPKVSMDLSFATKKHTKTSQKLQDLEGVGPKTEASFRRQNIKTVEQLFERYKEGGRQWLGTLIPFGASSKTIEKSILNINR
jgi:DNA polymerase III epsilon subunit-like protein